MSSTSICCIALITVLTETTAIAIIPIISWDCITIWMDPNHTGFTSSSQSEKCSPKSSDCEKLRINASTPNASLSLGSAERAHGDFPNDGTCNFSTPRLFIVESSDSSSKKGTTSPADRSSRGRAGVKSRRASHKDRNPREGGKSVRNRAPPSGDDSGDEAERSVELERRAEPAENLDRSAPSLAFSPSPTGILKDTHKKLSGKANSTPWLHGKDFADYSYAAGYSTVRPENQTGPEACDQVQPEKVRFKLRHPVVNSTLIGAKFARHAYDMSELPTPSPIAGRKRRTLADTALVSSSTKGETRSGENNDNAETIHSSERRSSTHLNSDTRRSASTHLGSSSWATGYNSVSDRPETSPAPRRKLTPKPADLAVAAPRVGKLSPALDPLVEEGDAEDNGVNIESLQLQLLELEEKRREILHRISRSSLRAEHGSADSIPEGINEMAAVLPEATNILKPGVRKESNTYKNPVARSTPLQGRRELSTSISKTPPSDIAVAKYDSDELPLQNTARFTNSMFDEMESSPLASSQQSAPLLEPLDLSTQSKSQNRVSTNENTLPMDLSLGSRRYTGSAQTPLRIRDENGASLNHLDTCSDSEPTKPSHVTDEPNMSNKSDHIRGSYNGSKSDHMSGTKERRISSALESRLSSIMSQIAEAASEITNDTEHTSSASCKGYVELSNLDVSNSQVDVALWIQSLNENTPSARLHKQRQTAALNVEDTQHLPPGDRSARPRRILYLSSEKTASTAAAFNPSLKKQIQDERISRNRYSVSSPVLIASDPSLPTGQTGALKSHSPPDGVGRSHLMGDGSTTSEPAVHSDRLLEAMPTSPNSSEEAPSKNRGLMTVEGRGSRRLSAEVSREKAPAKKTPAKKTAVRKSITENRAYGYVPADAKRSKNLYYLDSSPPLVIVDPSDSSKEKGSTTELTSQATPDTEDSSCINSKAKCTSSNNTSTASEFEIPSQPPSSTTVCSTTTEDQDTVSLEVTTSKELIYPPHVKLQMDKELADYALMHSPEFNERTKHTPGDIINIRLDLADHSPAELLEYLKSGV